MNLDTQYTDKGILFKINNAGVDTFPINQDDKNKIAPENWERLNALEQLWYDGALIFDKKTHEYLLPSENCLSLDDEAIAALELPKQNANLAVFEKGNLGSSMYKIQWAPLLGNNIIGRYIRKGPVIEYGKHRSMLSLNQYDLVTAIESGTEKNTIESRARYHSQISNLAKRAEAKTDKFMEKREFLFADEVDFSLSSDNPKEITFTPEFPELPEDIKSAMPQRVGSSVRLHGGARQRTVFTSPQAQDKYNRIADIPKLEGTDVPAFLDNPLSFVPEDIVFDEELFSERVKGLKIKKASAVPYVHIEADKENPGWFNVNSGFSIQNPDSDTDSEAIEVTEEFNNLMHAAAEAGEKYFFYQNQWIKVNPSDVKKFDEAEEELGESCGRHISAQQCKYVLDIYDNLDRVDYNEALLNYRNQDAASVFDYAVPSCFSGVLRPHQMEGYCFLCAHYASNTGVLLADDMGLGKTVQIIAFLSYLYSIDNLATALLVMPKSLIDNWQKELGRFLPAEKKIYIHQGSHRYRNADSIRKYDIVLTTYETLARDQTMLGTISWTCVICDEVQKIKNFNTLAASAIKGMNTKYRVAMTGTPVENRLAELWSIADFAQPGLLDSYQVFRKKYELPLGNCHGQDESLAADLVQKLSPIFLRRTKEILADNLPGKSEETVKLSIDPASERLYWDLIHEQESSDQNGMILATIQKLLMLCSHPRLVTGENSASWNSKSLIQESPKLKWTVEKLREIFNKGEKVIIFTKYKRMQAILSFVIFEEFGIDSKIINGEVTGNRLGIIEEFSRRPGADVIILSPKAAGVGLTITAANHVIHYTREWNPAVENQATDRAYRIGQTKPVTVYYPVICSDSFITAEQKLDELLSSKRELMKNVIIPADLNIKLEDFNDVFSKN